MYVLKHDKNIVNMKLIYSKTKQCNVLKHCMYILNHNKNIVNMKLIDRMRKEQIVIF